MTMTIYIIASTKNLLISVLTQIGTRNDINEILAKNIKIDER